MKCVVIVGLLGLAGCASTQKVLDQPAKQVFHSEKSADEVACCLANKNNTAPMPRDDGSRVVLLKNGYGGVAMAFSIYPEDKGSRIEWREAFETFGGTWKQCVGLKPTK